MKESSEKADFFVGSGNVFTDLGLSNPEECQLKAYLIMEIEQAISGDRLTKKQAAQKLGLSQHNLSELLEGALSDFSLSQLIGYLNCLGREVELSASIRERVSEVKQAQKSTQEAALA
ncbi:MAG: helix-turn-helix domain-containing protein [Janthinobacterium lividum]